MHIEKTARKLKVAALLAISPLALCLYLCPPLAAIDPSVTMATESNRIQGLVGSSSCSARACHGSLAPAATGAIQHDEHTTWMMQDKHAGAYQVLLSERSARIALLLGANNPQRKRIPAHQDDRCLACHTNGLRLFDLERMPHLREERFGGTGCESCHGAARDWLGPHTRPGQGRRKLALEEKKRLGMVPTADLVQLAKTCVDCHVGAPPNSALGLPERDVNHDLIASGHPRLNFEFSSYFANVPRHWKLLETQPDQSAKAWVLGQAVTAQAALRLLQYRAAGQEAKDEKGKAREHSPDSGSSVQEKPWPELAEYDCFACHHDLQQSSWRSKERKSPGLPPGSLPWGTWYFSLLPRALAYDSPQTGVGSREVHLVLDQLYNEMAKGQPRRERVNTLCADLSGRIEKDLVRLAKAGYGKETLRPFLTSLADADQVLFAAGWDSSAQTYNALAALNESYKDKQIGSALELFLKQLAFPSSGRSERYDSPKEFAPLRRGKPLSDLDKILLELSP
jgi:hypothetical protein